MDYNVNDQTIGADEEGYITDMGTWSKELADQ
ncbi:MAG: sulfurtransferase TusE, partial [Rhodospirillaceae bacterium]|nr:sulfurtransferase TusE [Rhodospirillaceae bacterium]